MGLRWVAKNSPVTVVTGLFILISVGGCQTTQSLSVDRLIAHQAMIDFSGLGPTQTIEQLKVTASIPRKWEALPLQESPLYVHQQWRSASHSTGVGVAYVHLPLPVSAKTIIWFAKMQYSSQNTRDGKPQGNLLGEWTDAMGREWFEAENYKFHVKGYAITKGFDAWIVYSGYRIRDPMKPAELGMAARSMDSILPTPIAGPRDMQAMAAAEKSE
jgi:hypothetical protein